MHISTCKKISIVLGILLLAITTSTAFSQHKRADGNASLPAEIVFSGNKWKEIIAAAKKSGKYIFVDAYTSWCGPCKLLKSTTFKHAKTAAFFNKHFINYTVDMEKGEGITLAEKWKITAYPTLLFFNPEGKMILMQIGYVDGEQLVEFGKQALAKR